MTLNSDKFLNQYWKYYLTLEQNFIELEKIIPIDSINKDTFSFKYLELLFSVCSEIDVVFKQILLLNNFSGNPKDWDMSDYMDFIKLNCNRFTEEIVIYKDKKECSPFSEWADDKNLTWWTKYNLGKHHRTDIKEGLENYKRVNQETVLLSMCGLYQLELYFYAYITKENPVENDLRVPVPPSKILELKNWPYNKIFISDNTFL